VARLRLRLQPDWLHGVVPIFARVPGVFPEALARRNHLFRVWRRTASAFGFSEYDAPILEPLDLYKAKSGEEIEQQLFSFTTRVGGRWRCGPR